MSDGPDAVRPLAGLKVAAFEARLAGPLASLIAKHGGEAVEAPALREVPLGEDPRPLTFARSLLAGDFDAVLFLTGVGSRYLAQAVAEEVPLDALKAALAHVKVIVRGPKPLSVMREWGVRVDVTVPEPNTWRDILSTLDARLPVQNLRIAVQEYGKPNPELVNGLTERGATVTTVPVYRWALPEDVQPLRRAIADLCDGSIGAVLFTSAQQVVHVLQVAAEDGREVPLRDALARRVVVGSIGPTTTETLREQNLPVDIEPEHPKMGHLVVALAQRWRAVGKGPPPA